MNPISFYKPAPLFPRAPLTHSPRLLDPAPVGPSSSPRAAPAASAIAAPTSWEERPSRPQPTELEPPIPRARSVVQGYDPGSVTTDSLGREVKAGPQGTLFFEPDPEPKDKEFDTGYPGEVYYCHGIPTAADFPKDLRQDWKERMRVTPRQFFRTLFDTPQVKMGGSVIRAERDSDGLRGLELEIDIDCPKSGRPIGRMDRAFSFPEGSPPEVYHSFFDLDRSAQGAGIAKDMLANSVKLYDKMGVAKVSLFAAMDVGGYAWAKYGFRPKPGRETAMLFATVGERLDDLRGVPAPVRTVVKRMLESGDPKAIWAISDLDGVKIRRGGRELSLGKALLLGTNWKGFLELGDQEARARFDQYVSKAKTGKGDE